MKKTAKSKSKAKKRARKAVPAINLHVPFRKAAIRSHAFARAILDAKARSTDPERLQELFAEAAAKAATMPREPFKENWAYLQAMLRLLRAYYRKEYRQISESALLPIVAAVSYLVDPFDLIPDEIPFLGYLDDSTVLAFAVQRTRPALDDFMVWETVVQ